MKIKFIVGCIALAATITACRQSDETVLEETAAQQALVTESAKDGESMNDPDKGDPPRDGSHWKTTAKDSVAGPRAIGVFRSDSLGLQSAVLEGGPKDTPRDGSHWRKK